MKIERLDFKDNELKQLIRNANKRLDRLSDRYGDSTYLYKMQAEQFKENHPELFIQKQNNKFSISTDLSNINKREKQQLYAELFYNWDNKGIRGISSIKYEVEQFFEDPDSINIFVDEMASKGEILDEDDINLEDPHIIDEALKLMSNFKEAIHTYQEKGYTADELGVSVLHKSHNTYSELYQASKDIWNALSEKKKQTDKMKNEAKIKRDQDLRDYYQKKALGEK